MKKRLTSLALAAALCLGALSGCGGTTPAASPAPGTSPAAPGGTPAEAAQPISEYPITSDPITLTYWITLPAPVSKIISNLSENKAFQQMEKDTGVKIEFIHPTIGQEKEQFNLLMASGKLPDIIGAPNLYKGGEFQGMADGMFIDLTDMIPTYAPDYYKYIQKDEVFFREISTDAGRIPAVYGYKVEGDSPFRRVLLRQDMLDEMGVEVPLYIEDYEAMFDKMLAKGVTPYSPDKKGYEEMFTNLFDVHINGSQKFYKDLDDKVHFAPLEPGFKEYLTLMNKWYSKGYISKDFTSVDNSQVQTMFDTGKIGMFMDASVGNFNRAQRQGFTVTTAPAPRLHAGQKLHYESVGATPKMPQNETMAAISKDCKNPEIALRWLNYFYTEAGAELMNWGIEGLNWSKVDGKNTYNDLMLNNPDFGTEEASYYYKMHFIPKLNYPDVEVHANLLKSPESLEIRLRYGDDPDMDSAYILPNVQYSEDEITRRTKIFSPVDTYVDEMTLKFIVGAEPMENYDKFIETMKGMGIEEAVEITQSAYDRYIKKTR